MKKELFGDWVDTEIPKWLKVVYICLQIAIHLALIGTIAYVLYNSHTNNQKASQLIEATRIHSGN